MRQRARVLADRLPSVVASGGVFDDDAWQPALEAARVPFHCTRVFASGANTLVLVGERWLIHPTGATTWGVRKWRGWRDPEFDAAASDEALDSKISEFVHALKGHPRLWRLATLIVPPVVLAARMAMRFFGQGAMERLLAGLTRLLH